jgi:hypothetical protein
MCKLLLWTAFQFWYSIVQSIVKSPYCEASLRKWLLACKFTTSFTGRDIKVISCHTVIAARISVRGLQVEYDRQSASICIPVYLAQRVTSRQCSASSMIITLGVRKRFRQKQRDQDEPIVAELKRILAVCLPRRSACTGSYYRFSPSHLYHHSPQ